VATAAVVFVGSPKADDGVGQDMPSMRSPRGDQRPPTSQEGIKISLLHCVGFV
jgi:hypothetical protein